MIPLFVLQFKAKAGTDSGMKESLKECSSYDWWEDVI
jgi:hypothetical protein